jgi:hypothetical protein
MELYIGLSLFEEKNIKKFYDNCPTNVKTIFDEFKNKQFNTYYVDMWKLFFPLVAIYFNIDIIIMDINKQKLEEEYTFLKYIQSKLELNPEESIRLHLRPDNIEYMPEDNEIEIYEIFMKKLKDEIRLCNKQATTDYFMSILEDAQDTSDIKSKLKELEDLYFDFNNSNDFYKNDK